MKVNERTSTLQQLNRDLEVANHKIESASKMQLQHFAAMSHEIRTPLNCIIGMSSLLEETDLDPMQRESMEMIISSGSLLRQIVDDVLDCTLLIDSDYYVSLLFFRVLIELKILTTLSYFFHSSCRRLEAYKWKR
jgi:signal transduction histidine kinase